MRLVLVSLGLAACSFSAVGAVRADAFPPPERPEWNDPPAPLPDPPEDEGWRWIVPAALVAVAAAALARPRRAARGTA